MVSPQLLTPRQAAEKLGMSYPALKHWILAGRIETIASNTALQYHPQRFLWPEAEINSTFWKGGTNDSNKQTFIAPGLIFGRFPIHHRVAIVAGAGFQIATTHYHQYNHAVTATVRIPF